MWIKICGNTSLEDANLAAEAGADAAGFVFAPSPRQVTTDQVARIIPELAGDLTHVGVFHSRDFDAIATAVRATGLHGVQLHGGVDWTLGEKLRAAFGHRLFLIQSLHWSIDRDPSESDRALREDLRAVTRQGIVDAVLIDSKTLTASGGTGKSFDWARARNVVAAEAGKMRIILAGGLTPENVAEAVRVLRPWGVDVASGVERQPGQKDPARVQGFIAAARAAFAAIENVSPLIQALP